MNRWMIVIRGDDGIRSSVLRSLNHAFNSNLDHARAITLSLGISDKMTLPEKKAAGSTIRKRMKQIMLHGSESVFIIDSPNRNPNDWLPLTNIGNILNKPLTVIGIDICKYKHDEKIDKTNKHRQLTDVFIAGVYKYYYISDEDMIPEMIKDILSVEGYSYDY